jgi:sugar lactone lactonase YvrE
MKFNSILVGAAMAVLCGRAAGAPGGVYVSLSLGPIVRCAPGGATSVFAPNPVDTSGINLYDWSGLAFGSGGTLYAGDPQISTIDAFAPDGTRSVFATPVYTHHSFNPAGLAFDGAGNLYVADVDGGAVAKFTPSGAVSQPVAGLGGPQGVAVDGAGNVYVTSVQLGTVTKYAPNGSGSLFATIAPGIHGIALDAAGNVYVANSDGNAIDEFTPAGVESLFATAGLNYPYGLAFDSAGNLYVANYGGGTIEEFAPDGVGTVFASGLTLPEYIAIDTTPEPATLSLLALGGLALLRRMACRPSRGA